MSALVPSSIVPIRPPMTGFDILSEFRSLSTILHIKAEFSCVLSPLLAFNVLAKSGSFVLDSFSAMLNGIVLLKVAFVESALKRERDVAIEYCVAAVS